MRLFGKISNLNELKSIMESEQEKIPKSVATADSLKNEMKSPN